jgi:hypothetical protein
MNQTAAMLSAVVAVAGFALTAHLRDRRHRTATCERMMKCLCMAVQRDNSEDSTPAGHGLAPAG